MRHLMLSVATIVLALGMSACEREVRTSDSRTVVQPPQSPQVVKEKETVVEKTVPGPAGPAGPAGPEGAKGDKGDTGKPGGDTVVVVPPAQKKE